MAHFQSHFGLIWTSNGYFLSYSDYRLSIPFWSDLNRHFILTAYRLDQTGIAFNPILVWFELGGKDRRVI